MTHTDTAVAIRERDTDRYAAEADDGTMIFTGLCARTLFFDAGEEALYSHMSAAPAGHDSVEEVTFERTLRIIQPD